MKRAEADERPRRNGTTTFPTRKLRSLRAASKVIHIHASRSLNGSR